LGKMKQGDARWPDGVARVVLDAVDSTSAEAVRRLPAGAEWILAHHQSAARGRRGRIWHMPAGNFAASLVLPCSDPPERRALRSFVAALALFDALVAVTGRSEGLALKWPNDALLNGGKLAGILLESHGSHLIIGIGVNLAAAPDAADVEAQAVRPVSLLGETGILVLPEDFLQALAAAFALREASFVQYGFAPTRREWLNRAARLGAQITARSGKTQTSGLFETVDARGQIVLITEQGRMAIPAAEIFF